MQGLRCRGGPKHHNRLKTSHFQASFCKNTSFSLTRLVGIGHFSSTILLQGYTAPHTASFFIYCALTTHQVGLTDIEQPNLAKAQSSSLHLNNPSVYSLSTTTSDESSKFLSMALIPVHVGHVGGFEGHGHALFVITLVFTIAAASMVAVRMAARIPMKATGKDDYTILASLVSPLCSRLKKLSGRTITNLPASFP